MIKGKSIFYVSVYRSICWSPTSKCSKECKRSSTTVNFNNNKVIYVPPDHEAR